MTAYGMARMARLMVEEAVHSMKYGNELWAVRCLAAAEASLDRVLSSMERK